MEPLPAQTLISKAAVEALSIRILPGTTRFNVEGCHTLPVQPLLNGLGDQLQPVITPDTFGRTLPVEQMLQLLTYS